MSQPKTNIVWYDIPALDIDRAIRFYSAVLSAPVIKEVIGETPLGWLPTPDGGRLGCVCVAKGFRPSPDGVMIYLSVNGRLEEAVAAVRAEVLDSEGNCIALHAEELT
jgi:hypothetical protein